MSQQSKENSKKTLISVVMQDRNTLYQAYMPFLKNGGLFVSTEHQYEMGDSVFIRLTLPGETEAMPVACTVVWISSTSCKNMSGAGLHFTDFDDTAKNKIETLLADLLHSDRPTCTM